MVDLFGEKGEEGEREGEREREEREGKERKREQRDVKRVNLRKTERRFCSLAVLLCQSEQDK